MKGYEKAIRGSIVQASSGLVPGTAAQEDLNPFTHEKKPHCTPTRPQCMTSTCDPADHPSERPDGCK
eukprot:m.476423 g.476423  ORF g.476423 m.476423 type:complete len:67 (-) comp40830_c0_seq1:257-457(-)